MNRRRGWALGLAVVLGCSNAGDPVPAGSTSDRDAGDARTAEPRGGGGGGDSPGAGSDPPGGDSGTPGAGDAARPDGGAEARLPELCSGCPGEMREVGDNAVHFHHAHLNTHDPAASIAFYEEVFGARRVRLNDRADVLKADGAFILLHEVDSEPTDALETGIEHIGWGAIDVNAWWEQARMKDVVHLDQRSAPLEEPFELFAGFLFLYLQGPSNERIEVNTASHDEFGHVHFMTDDVDATVAFYAELLAVQPAMPQARQTQLPGMFGDRPIEWTSNSITIDKVNMIFFGPPSASVPERFEPTDGHPIDHIAFAFADLDPVLERAQTMGAAIESGPELDTTYGFRSVFVRAPNQVLIELVEAAAVPNPFP